MKELLALAAIGIAFLVLLWVFWWIAPLIVVGAVIGGFLFG